MSYLNNPVKLGQDGYAKGGPSYTEELTNEEILAKLIKYEEVDDINSVPLNTHVRYFVYDPKTKVRKFRLGGFLRKNDDARFVVLSNQPVGGKTWTAQTEVAGKKTAFFKLKNKADLEIKEKTGELEELYEQARQEIKAKQVELDKCKEQVFGNKQTQTQPSSQGGIKIPKKTMK